MGAEKPLGKPAIKICREGVDPSERNPAHAITMQKIDHFIRMAAKSAEVFVQDIDTANPVAMVGPQDPINGFERKRFRLAIERRSLTEVAGPRTSTGREEQPGEQ